MSIKPFALSLVQKIIVVPFLKQGISFLSLPSFHFQETIACLCRDFYIIIISFLKVWAEAMEKSNAKMPAYRDSKAIKIPSTSSKNKK